MKLFRKAFLHYQKVSLLYSLIGLTLLLGIAQCFYHFYVLSSTGMMNTIMLNTLSLRFLVASTVMMPLLSFLFIQALIYAAFIVSVWYAAVSIGRLFSLRYKKVYGLGIFIWLFSVVWIVSANTVYFHHSDFALHNHAWLHDIKQINNIGIWIFAFIFLLIIINFLHVLLRRRFKKIDMIFLICFVILLCWHQKTRFASSVNHVVVASQKPNIILISIEALRPEYVYQRYHYEQTMPFLANLLQSSIQFTDAYTPIAQSFPAWMSLLTAKTPMHNGARSLYTPYHVIDFHDSLNEKLKQAGYQTFYAVDGQRFGEITKEAGFDHVISPPFGAAELIIGYLSDFPLSNLVGSTIIGKDLFPWYYANRSVSVTYYPDDFISLIRQGLEKRNDQPVFFAIHFGLSHWPYVWANDRLKNQTRLPEKYQYSLHAADQQIQNFFILLQEENLLDHAIIVLMSDHGIGLGLPHDRIIAENNYVGDRRLLHEWEKITYSIPQSETLVKNNKGIDTSYGYSTDVLSLTQYQVLLAFKTIGFNLATPKNCQRRASLLDVAPTILAMINLPPMQHADGVSLLNDITQENTQENMRASQQKSDQRIMFFENGFTTPEIAKSEISANGVLEATINIVGIDHLSGLLYITDEAWKPLLKNKQRAMLMGDWLLAWYPDKSAPILVNIETHKWTMDFNSTLAKQAPLQLLMQTFSDYNQKEVKVFGESKL